MTDAGGTSVSADNDGLVASALSRNSSLAVLEVGHGKLLGSCRMLLCGSDETSFDKGDLLLVDTEKGLMYVRATTGSERRLLHRTAVHRIVKRLWGERARQQLERDKRVLEGARKWFKQLVASYGLEMSYSSSEMVHGPQKVIIYFTAPGRQDFRALLRDLSQRIRMRVELRQIGVRDGAKCVGGIGPCGLVVCCHEFLHDFGSVTIKMAKAQGLVLSSQKVSGLCGRMMCCLGYEYPFYCSAAKMFPKVGTQVYTPRGTGRVKELNILRNQVKVLLDAGELETFGVGQIRFKRSQEALSEPHDTSVSMGGEDSELVEQLGEGDEQSS